MRRRLVVVLAAGAAVLWGGGPTPAGSGAGAVRARTVLAAGSVGRAIEVPGLGALNRGGNASVNEVSCGSAGNCSAGGFYADQHGHSQGFVAAEKNGRWGTAIEVPGLGTLNSGRDAEVDSVSCGSAGNCAAVGDYRDQHRHYQGFAVTEKNGRWGTAAEVPDLGALNKGGDASLYQVSCGSAGNCAAGGSYRAGSGHLQAFTVSEVNGRWQAAVEVPGMAALNAGRYAEVLSVSCGPAGDCAAGGVYTDRSGNNQGFVAVGRNVRWGRAIEVPGLGVLNRGGGNEDAAGGAEVDTVSCGRGDCAAGGNYTDKNGHRQGFAVTERNGRWGRAIEVPGLQAMNSNGDAEIFSVSCTTVGNCTAGGDYYYDYDWGFVTIEKNGVWGRAMDVPGLGALASGRYAGVQSVSCASPGTCAVSGDYEDMSTGDELDQGYVASERNGHWGQATEVPTGPLSGFAVATSVSCAPDGGCAAGGNYSDDNDHQQGFVT